MSNKKPSSEVTILARVLSLFACRFKGEQDTASFAKEELSKF
jgi:hypothetical protein